MMYRLLPALFAFTLLVSAGLLFALQPLVARLLLPSLGGTPAVWNTCMVFFQALLLAGYAAAHAGPLRLGPRRHALLHLTLLAAAWLVLPISIPQDWAPPTESSPVLWLLGVLLVRVGLPFFVLATTAPLLQRWFAATAHHSADDPYYLYAASNLGSFVALLAYPTLLEPAWSLPEQAAAWSWGFAALGALTCACAAAAFLGTASGSVSAPAASPMSSDAVPPWRWVLLAFIPSSLLLSVTTHLTTDVAPVPLLWVVPLALYLLTFTLTFARRPLLSHRLLVAGQPVIVIVLLLALLSEATEPAPLLVAIHLAGLFVLSMVCHGELARTRPPSDRLTAFYLWIALGGVLGGVFNALLSPLIFSGLAEYAIVLVLACLLCPGPKRQAGARTRLLDLALPALLVVVTGFLAALDYYSGPHPWPVRLSIIYGGPVLACYAFADRPIRFGLAVGALLLVALFLPGVHGTVLEQERTFFGVHRVAEDPARGLRLLYHGNTVHGCQSLDPARRGEPLAYYHTGSPIGVLFDKGGDAPPRRVALIGLGVGSLAAYGRAGDTFTFYEIDPTVIRLARSHFSFLDDSAAAVEVVPGDARLTLARATGPYDLIVVDAFSSDAIPLHLITREALRLYLSKLADGGRIAFHVSNRYLDLEPVLGDLAGDAGLVCRSRKDPGGDAARGKFASHWVVMARREEDLGPRARSALWVRVGPRPGAAPWTDDYSNLLGALRWGE